MEGESFLIALSRIAITYITFASIVSILRHGSRVWTRLDVRGLKLMFMFDLGAALLALLPIPMYYSLGPKQLPLLWRICIGLMVAFLAFALKHESRQYKRVPGPQPVFFFWAYKAPMAAVILLQIAGFIFFPGIAVYSWGLYWLLIPPVIQFAIFLRRFDYAKEQPVQNQVGGSEKP